jgi:hypothetical protein
VSLTDIFEHYVAISNTCAHYSVCILPEGANLENISLRAIIISLLSFP